MHDWIALDYQDWFGPFSFTIRNRTRGCYKNTRLCRDTEFFKMFSPTLDDNTDFFIFVLIGLAVCVGVLLLTYCLHRLCQYYDDDSETMAENTETRQEFSMSGDVHPPSRGEDLPPSYDSVLSSGNVSPGIDKYI